MELPNLETCKFNIVIVGTAFEADTDEGIAAIADGLSLKAAAEKVAKTTLAKWYGANAHAVAGTSAYHVFVAESVRGDVPAHVTISIPCPLEEHPAEVALSLESEWAKSPWATGETYRDIIKNRF